MLLETLETRNFRNTSGKIVFRYGLNILIGDNGQGKTNFLEAIAVLATTKSFRTAKLQETIRFDEETAVIVGNVKISGEIARELRAVIQERVKQFAVNGKREVLQRYLGQLHAVVFTSDELAVVRGGPELRRRFLDDAIVAVHPLYAATVSEYARVIKQKNALLQNSRDAQYSTEKTAELVAPWNEQLAALSTKIHRSRVRIVERLNEMLERRLFGTEEVIIRYASSFEGKGDLGDYESLITERLTMRIQAELVAGHSLIGTHRDDLEIKFDGHDLRKYGSAGQQRSALLLLLLANIAVYHATRNEYPLFLIDDIDSELDYKRIGQLLEYLDGKTQTIVTTTKESFASEFGGGVGIFAICNGIAKPR
ncbi:MAG TPA: DNA replication and repair protein RecF [Pyrinomonadaceae bacterium]|nr:DNA replication and repair protein RecF [Pyrinomonadaceae bacterium]